jgi:hypothetical protein
MTQVTQGVLDLLANVRNKQTIKRFAQFWGNRQPKYTKRVWERCIAYGVLLVACPKRSNQIFSPDCSRRSPILTKTRFASHIVG